MEYIEGGDLSPHIIIASSNCSRNACEIARQPLEGPSILHDMKVYHRDLKPKVGSPLHFSHSWSLVIRGRVGKE